MTVFRKLKLLGYRTSYSHRGKYYALADSPQFNEQGLWSYRGVGFSRDGTLLTTAQRLVEQAPAGLTASELQAQLGVEVKQPLRQLYQQKRLERRVMGKVYVYLAREVGRQRQQRLEREARPVSPEIEEPTVAVTGRLSPELKAAIILFYSLLDERQRRLYAGLEAHKAGYGGDRKIAEFLGLDVTHGGTRAAGVAGRRNPAAAHSASRSGTQANGKKKPAVIEAIARLLRHETGGDPMCGLKWSRRACRKIARQLRLLKIRVSASTVRRLLKQLGFSLRVNHKRLESGNRNPPPRRVRNQQFTYIHSQRERFLARALPIISIDAKKKEPVGNFKNPGACWEKEPQLVKDHDFLSDALGRDLMTFSGAGAVIGALGAAWLGKNKHMGRILLVLLTLFGAIIVGFGLSRGTFLCALILFTGGSLFVMCCSLTTSLAQLLTPPEFRGRVVSIYLVAFLGGSPLGSLASGWLVTRVSSAPLILVVNGTVLKLVAPYFLSDGQGLKDIATPL